MKRYFKIIFVILMLLSVIRVQAEELLITERLDTTEGAYNDGSARKELDNYGVKKGIEVSSKNMHNILKTPYVDSSYKIYDYSNVLSEEDEKAIKNYIDNFISKTNMDMVFVTINMPYTVDDAHKVYASDFFDYNDFGTGEYYSGVLLLRNTYSSSPYFDMYMFGEAQLYFYDYRCDDVLDSIYNYIHNEEYVDGFNVFVNKLNTYYEQGKLDNYEIDENGHVHEIVVEEEYSTPLGVMALIGGIVDLIAIPSMIKKNKMVKPAYAAENYLDKATLHFNTQTDMFVSTHTETHIKSDNSSSGGHIHSSTGSSGRGFSSGGGRHG